MNKIYLFNRLRHIIFGEKFYKKLNFDWDVHYDRIQIIQNIITCLAKMPQMAEFWCFVGDYWYENKAFKHALKFYEYAIIAGKNRNIHDDWFIIPEKYKKYPVKMIDSCKKMIENQTTFKLK